MRQQCVVAPNGALAILDSSTINITRDRQTANPLNVCLYSATNAPERTTPVPPQLGTVPTLAYDGRHVVIAGEGWVYIYRANGQQLWRFKPPTKPGNTKPDDNIYWTPFLTDSGRTLCLFDGERNFYRYAMP